MSKKYQVIYADPPWDFGDRLRSSKRLDNGKMHYRELRLHYRTMKTPEICNLPISRIVDDSAVLLMWTTDAHVPDALRVMDAWGFHYKTIGFIWNKKYPNGNQVCYMGKWTMKGSEICLLGTRGRAHRLLKRHDIRQLLEAGREQHSSKPIEAKRRIEEMFPDTQKIELFARQKTEGWDVWGNEVESDIEL